MRNKAERYRRGRTALNRARRPVYPNMRPRVGGDHVVISAFNTIAEAWAWIDNNTFDGRKSIDTHHRIRRAFAGEWFDS